MYERALKGEEKALGSQHPSTLTTISNLAGVFYDMGQLEKAMEMLERALKGQEKALGSQHPETLRTARNFANLFGANGRRRACA